MLVAFLSTWQIKSYLEIGNLGWENVNQDCLLKIGLYTWLWGIFLINDWQGRAHLIGGGVKLGQLVLSCIKKVIWKSYEQQVSKFHSFVVSAIDPFWSFLPCLSAWLGFPCRSGCLNQIKPFFRQHIVGHSV